MSEKLPLVTFALFSYNQERYIREAVEAALAQDYPNLEIIISDDCSSDRTFDIANTICAGVSKVQLRKNRRNLGVARHINAVMGVAKGELVVAAAGDDVSEPDRCSALVSAWLAEGKKPDSLCSSVVQIDEGGACLGQLRCDPLRQISERMFKGQRWLIGSSHAWTRRSFEVFGDLPEWLFAEDKAIGFRGALLGGLSCVDRPLVKYRIHQQSISSGNSLAKSAKQSLSNLRAHHADILQLAALRPEADRSEALIELQILIAREIERVSARAELFSCRRTIDRVVCLTKSWRSLNARDIIRAFLGAN